MIAVKTQAPAYKSLYEMLDRFDYILANEAEKHVECNEPLLEALREANEEWTMNETMGDMVKYNGLVLEDRTLTDDERAMTVSEFLGSVATEDEKEAIDEYMSNLDYPEIYQTFVVDKDGYDILKDYGEIVWYNEDMDLHFWGVTHFGTAWSYVMGNHMPVHNKDYYTKA